MLAEAVATVRERVAFEPEAALILGTGIGASIVEQLELEGEIAYEEIPHCPVCTVDGHAGRLLFGRLGGKRVVVMQGRVHLYEGYTLQQVVLPVRVMGLLGARVLLVSNASGGLNPNWPAGDLVLLDDHINLLGDNPLIGPNAADLGPRFPDLSECYDAELRALARRVALEEGIVFREGVYLAVPGPSFETRAERRMMRTIGADVVGMSTIPEVIAARHMGLRVLGVSIVTALCSPDSFTPQAPDEVVRVAEAAEPKLARVFVGVLERLGLERIG